MKKIILTILILIIAVSSFMVGCSAPADAATTDAATAGAEQAQAPASQIDTTKPLQLATKPMTEQFIVAEMLKMVIEDSTDYTVEITKGVGGGTGNIQPAMEKGDFHMYPEYTGTGWQYVLKHEDIPPYEELFEKLTEEYVQTYGFEWVGMYGFADMYGIAIRKEIADEHNLKTYSDLAPVSSGLTFCAEPDFYEREDGYDRLCDTYGFNFSSTKDLDIGLKYTAINSGEVDVMDIFTTDGQLATADVTVLEDDKDYFINDYCGTVVRTDILEAYSGLREALTKLEGVISTEEMTQMNYMLEIEGQDEEYIARQFLESKGILK